MSTYEILSIVLVSINSLLAASSIITPIVLKFINNRTKLKLVKEKSRKQEFDNYFSMIEKSYDELAVSYSRWKTTPTETAKQTLLYAAYKLMHIASPLVKKHIAEFCDNISKGDNAKSEENFADITSYSGFSHIKLNWRSIEESRRKW